MKLLENVKRNKKGFTLIEMIVVIVIIGILLALLVPGILKYIDKAKEKQIEANARNAYVALQTAIAEEYGKVTPNWSSITSNSIKTVAEITGNIEATFSTTDGKISVFKYSENGKIFSYENKDWKVTSGSANDKIN